ncbi:TonB family protein [Roseicyclus sp.]|uniref:energy transducer TonB family protein n=1 Tax=Roseicyclus sp. TaxID=1914329 RepID=UPI003F6CD241
MRRIAEIAAFLGLSAAVHAGVMAGFSDGQAGPQAMGDGGTDRVTLAAAPESIAALAARWAMPPQPVISPTTLQAPQMPVLAAPAMPIPERAVQALTLPDAPILPRADAPPLAPGMADSAPSPLSPNALAQSPRPLARPDVANAPASTPQAPRLAQGQGGGQTSGAAPAPAQPTPALNQAQRQNLMAAWGGQIMARIERARPRVNAAGQVTLTLRIGRDGTLGALGVARSSGDQALDEAALSAVRRAGRFPAAPDALREASYAFTLPIRFR